MEDKNFELTPEELEQGAGGGIGPVPAKPGWKIPVTPKYPQPGQEEGRDGE